MRSHGGQPYLQCIFGEIDSLTQTCDLSLLVERDSVYLGIDRLSHPNEFYCGTSCSISFFGVITSLSYVFYFM